MASLPLGPTTQRFLVLPGPPTLTAADRLAIHPSRSSSALRATGFSPRGRPLPELLPDWARRPEEPKPDPVPLPLGLMDVIVLGTGVSTAVPMMAHILRRSCKSALPRKVDGLSCCEDALRNPTSKNRRNNVALLLRYAHPDGRLRCVMVDAGKTMRDAVLAQFPKFNLSSVDGV
eukprot:EG_transcript_29858